MSENREKKRVLVRKDVIISNVLKSNALDISEDGMYINTQSEFLQGGVLDLTFKINGTNVGMKAIVQHTQQGIGLGVKFLNVIPEHHRIIKRFVEQAEIPTLRKAGRTILLADDSPRSRPIYADKLHQEGFTVFEACNGVEALRQLQQMIPDIAILDLWMGGIGGFKILQLMQLNPSLRDIPVVVLSVRSVPADIQKAIALGVRDYLPKITTSPVKLAERVKMILCEKK